MKKILLFGAGNLLNITISYLKKRVKVLAIVDNDKRKWGTSFNGINIIPPCDIRKYNYDVIIISNENYCDQIRKQLKKDNITNVLPIYSKNMSSRQKTIMKCYITKYGLAQIWLKNIIKEQQFFPGVLGVLINPYYFSRKLIWKNLELNKGYITGRCMDFGCGSLPYKKLFNTKKYIGVEIESDKKLDNIVYYDGKHIPFKDGYFDSILCSEVLEHVPNIDEIIDELNRVLISGGYMLVSVPFVYQEHCMPYDYRRFTSVGIKDILEKHGFEILKTYKSGSFIDVISQIKGTYIHEKLSNKGIVNFIKKILVVFNNIIGIIEAKIIPFDNDIYLDNIIVCRKK